MTGKYKDMQEFWLT